MALQAVHASISAAPAHFMKPVAERIPALKMSRAAGRALF
jgi:hypothetical protein